MCTAHKAPPHSAATLRSVAAAVGYDTALGAVFQALNLVCNPWPAAEKRRAQAFVLAALDTIPHTAALGTFRPGNELGLVNFMERDF